MSVSNGQKANAATFNAAFISKSVPTTKGDLLARSSTDLVRVGVGTNGQVLTADSTETAGVKWADATGGGGSGVGGINYVTNFDAEVDTTGWATYSDAAGSAPVDGNGGTANITWTRTTTTPLRGVASFLFTKDAVNRRGQGASFNFNISDADKAKQMQITFDYQVVSGTYVTGDLTCYIVHDPNGTPKVIQPSAFQIENIGSGTTGLARLTFQTEMSAQVDYNLCFHVASTSALAYSLEFDNILLGPQVVPLGAPVTDWVSYTPSVSAISGTLTNFTAQGFWKRKGDSADYKIRLVFTGAPGTWSNPLFSLPSGQVIDEAKIPGGAIGGYSDENWGSAVDTGTQSYKSAARPYTTTTLIMQQLFVSGSTVVLNSYSQASPFTWASTDELEFTIKNVPIVGWSSSTVVSSSADTRVVAFHADKASGSSSSGTYQDVTSWTTAFDTHGSFNPITGVWNCVVPGIYRISAGVAFTASASGNIRAFQVLKNGSPIIQDDAVPNAVTVAQNFGSILTRCAVGDAFKVQSFQNTGASLNYFTANGCTVFSAELIQGPSQIAVSEVIAFQGTAPSNSISTSIIKVTGWTASLDTHASYNAANNRWICPAPGIYDLAVWLALQNTAIPSSVWIYINGIAVNGGKGQAYSNGSVYPVSNISLLRQLNSGDYIEIFAQAASSTTAIDAPSTSWKIKRLGGVM